MGTRSSLPIALSHLGLLGFLAVSAWSRPAYACSIKPYPDQFIVDSAPMTDPPDPPALKLVSVDVQRSEHAPPGSGDCKEVGSLRLQLAPADGSSWPAGLGVSLALVRGIMPAAFRIPSYALQTGDGSLIFAGGDDPSQNIDFVVAANAVNRAGTQSAPIEIHIVSGARASGCTVAGGHSRSWAVPVMLALLALAFARLRRPR